MRKQLSLLAVLVIILSQTVYSQMKYSGQLFSRPLYMNAAFAGSDNAPRLVYSYLILAKLGGDFNRSQNYASFDINYKSSGIGFEYHNIQEHMITNQIFRLSYTYEFEAGGFKIRPALSAGVNSMVIDNVKYGIYPYVVDIHTGDTFFFDKRNTDAMFTLGAGLLAVYKDLSVGLYIDQLNRPVMKYHYVEEKFNPQILLHADYRFRIGKFADLIPGFVYFYNNQYNNGASYIDPSLRLRLGIVELGMSKMYSDQYFDATSLSAGLVWKYFIIKYSYTRRKTDLHWQQWLGTDHEISFSASLKKK